MTKEKFIRAAIVANILGVLLNFIFGCTPDNKKQLPPTRTAADNKWIFEHPPLPDSIMLQRYRNHPKPSQPAIDRTNWPLNSEPHSHVHFRKSKKRSMDMDSVRARTEAAEKARRASQRGTSHKGQD